MNTQLMPLDRAPAAPTFASDAERWAALRARDPRADGSFFYAVRTTGVFCRPSCASRLPLRANTEFFATARAAERAGYRACKRCRPDARHPRAEQIRRMCAYIDARLDRRITLSELSAELELSPFHLQRLFKAALGLTPREYQEAQRMQRFKASLQHGASISSASYDAGFGSGSRLYEKAIRHLGMRPGAYRRKAAGLAIRYLCIDSDLGVVLIAATERGVCRIALGSDARTLAAELRAEFSSATVTEDARALAPHARALREYLRGQRRSLDLPLDVRATAFQRAVWSALQAIPPGETRTYADIARQLGKPNAQRAVGNACAKNPVALAVPCHRALRSDGTLGGYAFGPQRKRKLLALERKPKANPNE